MNKQSKQNSVVGFDGYNLQQTGDKAKTLTGSRLDTNNIPGVVIQSSPVNQNEYSNEYVYVIEGNGSRPSHKGDGYKLGGAMYTLNTTEVHAICYGIGSYHSNAWKSKNSKSGVYVADKAKTLDSLNCGYPACNQGGICVVEQKKIST